MSDKNKHGGARWPSVVLGLLLALIGVALAGGGGMLIARGGSWYYLLMGLALLVSGVQLVRGRTSALAVYLLAFVATVAWAAWEAGLDFWALHARIFTFAGLLLLVFLVQPSLRRRARVAPHTGAFGALSALTFAGLAITAWMMFQPHGLHNETIATGTVPVTPATAAKNWANYGNGPGGDRFGALDQINRGNVGKLGVAWTYRTGEIADSPDGNGAEDQLTPRSATPSTSAPRTTT